MVKSASSAFIESVKQFPALLPRDARKSREYGFYPGLELGAALFASRNGAASWPVFPDRFEVAQTDLKDRET
jgi:hypothetical protein